MKQQMAKVLHKEDFPQTVAEGKVLNEQIERYSRHIILKEVGAKGQKKLLNAKVLIIGAGGLGAPAAMYLAAAGVGTIGIVDADEVDLSNLQRQIIHSTQDVGKAKVQSAKETMNALNPDVTVHTYREFVDSSNIMELIEAEKISDPQSVTVSVNEEFLRIAQYESYALKDGDEVEFLYFMGGGC